MLVQSRVAWECSTNTGGKPLPRLNTNESPIVNKYREGKLKSTSNEVGEKSLKALLRKREVVPVHIPTRSEGISRGPSSFLVLERGHGAGATCGGRLRLRPTMGHCEREKTTVLVPFGARVRFGGFALCRGSSRCGDAGTARGPHTRLETRTKEFSMYASATVIQTLARSQSDNV